MRNTAEILRTRQIARYTPQALPETQFFLYVFPVGFASTSGRLFYRDLGSFDGADVSTMGDTVKLVDNFDSLYEYVTNDGRAFWFRTNMDAPKYKVR